MQIIKSINQIVAFLLEIGMFIAIGYWGYLQGKSNLTKYSLAIFLPLIAIILWGIFAAPNSQYRLGFPVRIVFELCLFFIASYLLAKTGHLNLGIAFGIIGLTSEAIAFFFKQ